MCDAPLRSIYPAAVALVSKTECETPVRSAETFPFKLTQKAPQWWQLSHDDLDFSITFPEFNDAAESQAVSQDQVLTIFTLDNNVAPIICNYVQ